MDYILDKMNWMKGVVVYPKTAHLFWRTIDGKKEYLETQ